MKTTKPNVVLILNDDMGYSDLGCYGGEVHTPNLDRLAAHGLRFSQFYNTARCSPSRASLLTGLHPHQTGVGILTYDSGPEGYAGNLNHRCVTIPQALKANGYRTYMSGKWHVATSLTQAHRHLAAAARLRRVLRHHHRRRQLLRSQHADARQREHRARGEGARLLLHRRDQRPGGRSTSSGTSASIRARRSSSTSRTPRRTGRCMPTTRTSPSTRAASTRDGTRCARQRLERLVRWGILDKQWQLSPRDPTQPPWQDADHKAWLARCMEVYAAQIDRMDQGIGRILDALEKTGQLDDTRGDLPRRQRRLRRGHPRGRARSTSSWRSS